MQGVYIRIPVAASNKQCTVVTRVWRWHDRLPNKHLFKGAYLDAVGEPAASPRRHATRGAEWAYTLNPGDTDREVAVIMLDGRYDRSPLPCSVRRDE